LNTHETKQVILKNDIVTLKADKTHTTSASTKLANNLLVELGNYAKTIPYVAIYPAGKDEPITLDGLISRDQLISALDQAGPSLTSATASAIESSK